MWHDTGSGASELPSGGWLEPDEHAESPATKRRLKNLLDATGLTEQLLRSPPSEATPRTSAASTRERTSTASASSRRAAAARPGARRRSATALRDRVAGGRGDDHRDRRRSRRHGRQCLRARAPARPSRAARSRDGLLPLRRTSPSASVMRRPSEGIGRVAIVDWDVHHGNGTQAIFWDDPSVLAISLHQDGLYPARSGLLTETGGPAAGRVRRSTSRCRRLGNRRLPRRVRQGRGAGLEAFAPELIVVACGFDAGALDPLGRMMLPAAAFGVMTDSARSMLPHGSAAAASSPRTRAATRPGMSRSAVWP